MPTEPGADARSDRLTVVRGRTPAPRAVRGAVTCIGNFDGVHLGHRSLIETARAEAEAAGVPSAVLTFDPHPRAFFRPDEAHFRLTTEAQKLKIFEALGVEAVFLRPFDRSLADTSAPSFVRDLLAGELGVSALVVGSDFHFGRGREGNPAVLSSLSREVGLGCRIVPPVELDGAPVSSSRIRDALAQGDVKLAKRLLGHRWFVSGEVVGGDRRGRTLGFPTANVVLDPGCRLRHGIYAVRIALAPGDIREGVASFGRRPTFDDGSPRLETYVLDFDGDLYGRLVEVELVGWIRGEERFASAEELVARMRNDADAARRELLAAAGEVSFIG